MKKRLMFGLVLALGMGVVFALRQCASEPDSLPDASRDELSVSRDPHLAALERVRRDDNDVSGRAPTSRPSIGMRAVTGRVVDAETGRPVPNAILTLETREPGSGEVRRTGAESDGTFEFAELVDEVHWITAEAPGYLELEPIDVDHRSENRVEVEIELTPHPILSGWVVDPAGRAIAGATISVEGYNDPWIETGEVEAPTWQTDSSGRFEIRVPQSGVEVTYFVEAEGYTPETFARTAPAADTIFELQPVTIFHVVMYDARTGRELDDFEVGIAPASEGSSGTVVSIVPQGRAREFRLDASPLRFFAWAPGYVGEVVRLEFDAFRWSCTEDLAYVADLNRKRVGDKLVPAKLDRDPRIALGGSLAPVTHLAIPLEPGGSVTGRLVDSKGIAIAGANIRRTGPDDRWRATEVWSTFTDENGSTSTLGPASVLCRTGEDGEFEFTELPSGTLQLRVFSGRSGKGTTIPVTLAPGQHLDVGTVVAVRTIVLQGVLEGVRRRMGPDGEVEIIDATFPEGTETVPIGVDLLDANGKRVRTLDLGPVVTFFFDGLEPGTYRLRARLGPADDPTHLGPEITVEPTDDNLDALTLRLR